MSASSTQPPHPRDLQHPSASQGIEELKDDVWLLLTGISSIRSQCVFSTLHFDAVDFATFPRIREVISKTEWSLNMWMLIQIRRLYKELTIRPPSYMDPSPKVGHSFSHQASDKSTSSIPPLPITILV